MCGKRLARAMAVALPVATLCALVSCEGLPVGPSLANVQLASITLQSTTGNSALCCCRVVGTVTNSNSVSVHVTINFSGFDRRDELLSTIVYFIKDMQPRERHAVDAAGFVVPCSEISRLTWEVNVKGIVFPPL